MSTISPGEVIHGCNFSREIVPKYDFSNFLGYNFSWVKTSPEAKYTCMQMNYHDSSFENMQIALNSYLPRKERPTLSFFAKTHHYIYISKLTSSARV
jgi:hypothetical protein